MTIPLTELTSRLDDRLETDAYADVDPSANGLQVGPDERSVERVAFAVDAAAETIETAVERDADVLVTHHGLSWGGIERVTDRTYDRIAALIRNDVALYVSHLPLDGHPELGNAAGVADVLGLDGCEPFGELGSVTIGQRGRAAERYDPERLGEVLATELDVGPGDVRVLDFGPERIEDVAIVTGAGTDHLDEALTVGADALVTGEGKGRTYHDAKEAGMNVVLAGHYATETFGVRSLQEAVEGWGLETTFIDRPTGL